jgi:hypothetical protein
MAAEVLSELLTETEHTGNVEYVLKAGEPYAFTLNGDGAWAHWDGVVYVNFTAGSGKNLRGYVPVSGKIQLNWGSGTVTAGFILSPR